jgi:hypothetical protein
MRWRARAAAVSAAGAASCYVWTRVSGPAMRSSEPEEVRCRRLGLPTPDAAQKMRVVRLKRFVSDVEIEAIKAHVADVRACHLVGTLERSESGRTQQNGVWRTAYLHTNGAFKAALPTLFDKMRKTIEEVDVSSGWEVMGAFSKESLNFRTIECHEYHAGARLADAKHFDAGSLITMDVMLQDPGSDFSGGEFITAEADGTVTTHTFEKGDCLLFVSHKRHNVRPVTKGKRMALVAEIWHGEEKTCAHRCAKLEPCTFTLARSHMAQTAQKVAMLG